MLGSGCWAAWASAYAVNGVACRSASQCTGVDNAGQEVTFQAEAGGVNRDALLNRRTRDSRQGVAGTVIVARVTRIRHPRPVTVDGSNADSYDEIIPALTGIACLPEHECVAVDANGGEVTFNP